VGPIVRIDILGILGEGPKNFEANDLGPFCHFFERMVPYSPISL
jgi:hypothetical protein